MEINNKKNHLTYISVYFIMLLFAMCSTMNVFFYSNSNLYEVFDRTTVVETCTIPENIAANEGDGKNRTYSKTSFLNKNNSYTETITKNLCSILTVAAIPQGISLLLILITVFLFYFLTLFVLLPDGWTLINQKVRLDN